MRTVIMPLALLVSILCSPLCIAMQQATPYVSPAQQTSYQDYIIMPAKEFFEDMLEKKDLKDFADTTGIIKKIAGQTACVCGLINTKIKTYLEYKNKKNLASESLYLQRVYDALTRIFYQIEREQKKQ